MTDTEDGADRGSGAATDWDALGHLSFRHLPVEGIVELGVIAALQRRVIELEAEVRSQNRSTAEYSTQGRALGADCARIHDERDGFLEELMAMHSSNSWRLTSPLRRIVKFLKRHR